MSIKKYIVFGVLFLLAVALYVWSLELGDFTISLFAYSWTYSVFIWFMAPLVALFAFSLMHILFYSLINYLNNNATKRDINKLKTIINQRILNNNIDTSSIKSEQIKDIAKLIGMLKIDVADGDFAFDEDMASNLKYLTQIKRGKYVHPKHINLDVNSSYYHQNIINQINHKDSFAKEVFTSQDEEKYNDELRHYALCEIIKSNKIEDIISIIGGHKICDKGLMKLLKKDAKCNEKKTNECLKNSDILDFVKDTKLSKEQYLEIAKDYLKNCDPDRLISLFDDLKSNDENAMEAYLYILAQYEMLDKLRDILSSLKPNEAKPYKALLDLKDASKQYKISDFIN